LLVRERLLYVDKMSFCVPICVKCLYSIHKKVSEVNKKMPKSCEMGILVLSRL